MKRRSFLRGLGALFTAGVVTGAASARRIVEPDAELLALGHELKAASEAAMPSFRRMDQLQEMTDPALGDFLAASAEADVARMAGLPAPSKADLWASYIARLDACGFTPACNAESAAWDHLDKIAERIRKAPAATTPAGFLVKLQGLAHDANAADHSKAVRTEDEGLEWECRCIREVVAQAEAALR